MTSKAENFKLTFSAAVESGAMSTFEAAALTFSSPLDAPVKLSLSLNLSRVDIVSLTFFSK